MRIKGKTNKQRKNKGKTNKQRKTKEKQINNVFY